MGNYWAKSHNFWEIIEQNPIIYGNSFEQNPINYGNFIGTNGLYSIFSLKGYNFYMFLSKIPYMNKFLSKNHKNYGISSIFGFFGIWKFPIIYGNLFRKFSINYGIDRNFPINYGIWIDQVKYKNWNNFFRFFQFFPFIRKKKSL